MQIDDAICMELLGDENIVAPRLSEFNIFRWKSRPYIIDFPQSVDKRMHPNPEEILDRDIKNVVKYFSKYFDINLEQIRGKFQN